MRLLDNDKRRLFLLFDFVCVRLKDAAVVLDEFDHDLVTDILVLYCFEARSHTEDAGSKHSGEVESGHAVVFVVHLHEGEEVTEVAEETEVDVWKLLQQIS